MMKIIVSLLVLEILLSISNQDILSKFNQNVYKIKDKRSDVIRFNEKIFHKFEIKTFKYNRTTPAFNVTFHFKVNVEDKVEVVAQAYKFLSNEYRYFPIRFQVNLKKMYDANLFGLQNSKKCGNLTSFVFHKDVLKYFCNFVPDDHHFPPLMPNGMYKVEVWVLYLNEDAGLFTMYGEIYTPQAYPKK